MASKENIVEFGISNLHVCTYDVNSDGSVTMGTPIALPGSKSLSLEPDEEEQKFYADNTVYYSSFSDNGFTGSIEVAKFTDEFKTTFMNYVKLADGGVGQYKNKNRQNVCIMFECEGDAQNRRGILYNVSLGGIQRSYSTREGSKEPTTETMDITVVGDNATGLTRAAYAPDSSAYATLFTTPPKPVAVSEE